MTVTEYVRDEEKNKTCKMNNKQEVEKKRFLLDVLVFFLFLTVLFIKSLLIVQIINEYSECNK